MTYLLKTCYKYIVHHAFETSILGIYVIFMFRLGIYEIIRYKLSSIDGADLDWGVGSFDLS